MGANVTHAEMNSRIGPVINAVLRTPGTCTTDMDFVVDFHSISRPKASSSKSFRRLAQLTLLPDQLSGALCEAARDSLRHRRTPS